MKYLTAGGIAGLISRTVTAPIDRLKVLYQVHSSLALTGDGRPIGLSKGLAAIYKEGGIRGFWRGNLTNVMKVVPESSLFFGLFEGFKFYNCGEDHKTPSLRGCVVSAGAASFITSVTMYPMETIKARWMSSPTGTYKNVGDCLKQLTFNEGWRGLYKGLPIQLMGTVPFGVINLTLYESAKGFYLRKTGFRPSGLCCLFFGCMCGIVGQIVAYPSAIIRTRLQTQGTPGHPKIYERGARSCIGEIWKSEGLRGFYRGLLTTYMKVIPAMGITFGVYEIAVMRFGL